MDNTQDKTGATVEKIRQELIRLNNEIVRNQFINIETLAYLLAVMKVLEKKALEKGLVSEDEVDREVKVIRNNIVEHFKKDIFDHVKGAIRKAERGNSPKAP